MLGLSLAQKIAVYALPLILAITLHEASHAFVAKLYGDSTAAALGRLSLNPIRHIDLLGTIIFPLVGLLFGGVLFGWAKPVPINFNNIKSSYGVLWVAAAGPLMNFFMALLWGIVLRFAPQFGSYVGIPLSLMSQAGIYLNVSLGLINLLPVLPLDGGRIVYNLLPGRAALNYSKLEPYGFLILLLLLVSGFLGLLMPIVLHLANLILWITQS